MSTGRVAFPVTLSMICVHCRRFRSSRSLAASSCRHVREKVRARGPYRMKHRHTHLPQEPMSTEELQPRVLRGGAGWCPLTPLKRLGEGGYAFHVVSIRLKRPILRSCRAQKCSVQAWKQLRVNGQLVNPNKAQLQINMTCMHVDACVHAWPRGFQPNPTLQGSAQQPAIQRLGSIYSDDEGKVSKDESKDVLHTYTCHSLLTCCNVLLTRC